MTTPELTTPGVQSRAVAARVLADVAARKRTLDSAFQAYLPENGEESARDRAFVRSLVMTTLRRFGQIDAVLLAHLPHGLPKKADFAVAILRLAVAELFYLDQPAHAVLHSAVDAVARDAKTRHLKKLANAVLRGISRDRSALVERFGDPALNIPSWLFERWCLHYGSDSAVQMARALVDPPTLDLTPKHKRYAHRLAERLDARELPTGSLRLRHSGRINGLAGYDDGIWWVQDAAAALPARLFGDIEGRVVVDLCAAPGGKTMQLAAAGATVITVDAAADRLELIRQNLKRVGLEAHTVVADGRVWHPAEPVDSVLVDAPCSATGTIRRHPDILRHRSSEDIARLAQIQKALLDNAAGMVKPGGTLVYSTCSLEPEEGEHQIRRFLGANPDFQRRSIEPGEIGDCAEFVTADGDLRTLPHLWPTLGGLDGFFAARLGKRA